MRKIKILIIEDNSMDKRLIEEYLSDLGDLKFEITHAFRLKEAFNYVNTQDFDVATLDLGLPDSHGIETFEKFYAVFPFLPTIVVSGCDDPVLANDITKLGAHGYIVKGEFDQDFLVKEIKKAINRQTVRERTYSKVAANNKKDENERAKTQDNAYLKGVLLRDPEILNELVEGYLELIHASEDLAQSEIKLIVTDYYRRNSEAFSLININKDDMKTIHSKSLKKLREADKCDLNFEKYLVGLLNEVLKQFKVSF